MHPRLTFLILLFVAAPPALASGTAPYGPIDSVKLLKPEDKVDMASVPAPQGALVLFDGKSLAGWSKRKGKETAAFKLLDGGIMQVQGGDIITREKFDGKFKLHDNVKITTDNTTAGMGGDPCTPGPILLQDHGNPVQFRNIWIVKE